MMSQKELREMLNDMKKTLTELKQRIESNERELLSLKEFISSHIQASRIAQEKIVTQHRLPYMELIPEISRVEKRYGRTEVRPIPIRNLNRELYEYVKKIAETRGLTIGEVINEALRFYLENYNLAYLESKRAKLMEKLKEIGMAGFIIDREIREYLKSLYMEELEKIEEKIKELHEKGES